MYLPEYTSLCWESVNIKLLFHSYLRKHAWWRHSTLQDSAAWWLHLYLGSTLLKSQLIPATVKSILNEFLVEWPFLHYLGGMQYHIKKLALLQFAIYNYDKTVFLYVQTQLHNNVRSDKKVPALIKYWTQYTLDKFYWTLSLMKWL